MILIPILALSALLARPARQRNLLEFGRPACSGPDAELYFRHQPGCKVTAEWNGRRYELAYNQLGLRDRDYPTRAPKGVKRVLLVGPSLLVGPGLPESMTPPRLAEQELRKAGERVEIVNASSLGFGPIRSSLLIRRYLEATHPDLVVYFFWLSGSPFVDAIYEPYWVPGDAGAGGSFYTDVIRPGTSGFGDGLLRLGLNRFLTLFHYSARRLTLSLRFLLGRIIGRADLGIFLDADLRAVERMRTETERHGARFSVVMQTENGLSNGGNIVEMGFFWVPWLADKVTPPIYVDYPDVEQYLRGRNFAFEPMRLVGEGTQRDNPQNRLSYTDPHLNEQGSRALASELASAIRKLLREKAP